MVPHGKLLYKLRHLGNYRILDWLSVFLKQREQKVEGRSSTWVQVDLGVRQGT